MRALWSRLFLTYFCLGCSALPGEVGDPTAPGVDEAQAGAPFPDLVRWGRPLATVQDPEQGETRTILRSPEGDVWAKVHHPPDQLDVITRIDVRRRVGGTWRYETWDAARQQPARLDPEACQLCHSMAPQDGTWTGG